jgi:20S proteasome subunit alpha 6
VGPAGEYEINVSEEGSFRILEGESVDVYIKALPPKEAPAPPPAAETGPAGGDPVATGDEDVQMAG